MQKTIVIFISFFFLGIDSSFAIGPNCSRDFKELYKGLQRRELWALSMFDSTDKIPSGLLLGRRTALGQFEECLKVVQPNFTGKHCVVELAIKRTVSNITLLELPSPLDRIASGQFSYGVCIPSSCNSADLKNLMRTARLDEVFVTDVNERKCVAQMSSSFRTKDYVVVGVFWLVVALALASTAYDVHHTFVRKSESQSEVLTSFSLRSNLKRLFHADDSSQEMNVLYGIRFFSFAWMVFGHLYFFEHMHGTDVNVLEKLSAMTSKMSIHGSNAYLCVDTFFFLNGLLVCFGFFRQTSETERYDAPLALFRRYLRLTPSLAVLILFNWTILSRIVVAPYATVFLEEIEEHCRTDWWIYLLHVQNLFQEESKTCFSAGWYVSAYLQLFLVSPLILYVLLLWPKFAPKYLFVLTLGSSLLGFGTSYGSPTTPNHTFDYARPECSSSRRNEYVWFHARMAPWLVGVATAYAVHEMKTKNVTFRLKKVRKAAGWLVCALLSLFFLYGIAAFFPFGTALNHPAVEKSLLRALHRLSLSCIVIASVNGYGGMINGLLSCNVFQPLSRLSYCAFLALQPLQTYRSINEYKTVKHYSPLRMTYTFLGDLVMSLVIAIPITLLIEMPLAQIERSLLKNVQIFPYPKARKAKP